MQAAITLSTDPAEVEARHAKAAAERKVYEALKKELWRWSLGMTALCFAFGIALFSRVRACVSLTLTIVCADQWELLRASCSLLCLLCNRHTEAPLSTLLRRTQQRAMAWARREGSCT